MHERAFRHRAVGCRGGVEEHAPPVRKPPHAVTPDHPRQRGRAGVEAARGLQQVEVVDARRRHVSHRLAVAGDGLVEVVDTGSCPVLVQHGRLHASKLGKD